MPKEGRSVRSLGSCELPDMGDGSLGPLEEQYSL